MKTETAIRNLCETKQMNSLRNEGMRIYVNFTRIQRDTGEKTKLAFTKKLRLP